MIGDFLYFSGPEVRNPDVRPPDDFKIGHVSHVSSALPFPAFVDESYY